MLLVGIGFAVTNAYNGANSAKEPIASSPAAAVQRTPTHISTTPTTTTDSNGQVRPTAQATIDSDASPHSATAVANALAALGGKSGKTPMTLISFTIHSSYSPYITAEIVDPEATDEVNLWRYDYITGQILKVTAVRTDGMNSSVAEKSFSSSTISPQAIETAAKSASATATVKNGKLAQVTVRRGLISNDMEMFINVSSERDSQSMTADMNGKIVKVN